MTAPPLAGGPTVTNLVGVQVGRIYGGNEVAPGTWEIDFVKYAVGHDCGNVVNLMITKGRVRSAGWRRRGGRAVRADGLRQGRAAAERLVQYASVLQDIDRASEAGASRSRWRLRRRSRTRRDG